MYTKLFGSIVHSTIWREPDYVRLLWITMLALADKNGCVWASVPGLADAARLDLADAETAIGRLKEPDPYSRTQVAEGRRIEEIDGGWWLINFDKFQSIKNIDERRESVRLAVKRHRARRKEGDSTTSNQPVINVIIGNQGNTGNQPVSPSDQTRPDITTLSDSPCDSVLKHYLAVHPRRRIGTKDRKAVTAALKMGYTPAELCEAIDGNAHDAWHKERHKHELPYVLRDTGHIDDARAKGEIGDLGSLVVAGDMSPELERLTRPRSG